MNWISIVALILKIANEVLPMFQSGAAVPVSGTAGATAPIVIEPQEQAFLDSLGGQLNAIHASIKTFKKTRP